jgi:uncharacterized protein YkwD
MLKMILKFWVWSVLSVSLAGCQVVASVPGFLTGERGTSTYVVQAGDCLACIAARYGVSMPALIDANKGAYPGIAAPSSSNRIQVGWVLAIPAGGQIVQPAAGSPVVAVLGAEPGAPVQAAAAGQSPAAVVEPAQSDADLALEVVRLTNAERVKAGLNELIVDEGLMDVGRRRAAEIVTDFSHNQLRAECAVCGENIIGPALASGPFLVERWMNSAGHRANILSAIAVHTGVGVYRLPNGTVYVSQVFTQ